MRAAFLVSAPEPATLRAINYGEQLELFARSRRGVFRSAQLRSLLTSLGESYAAVFARLDCSAAHGVELISQTDMFMAEPEGRVIRRDSMQRPEHHVVEPWQILISGAGQMEEGNLFGRSIIADRRLTGKYLGGHAVRLSFESPGSDVNLWTYAFLNTSVGLKTVKACAYGTSVPGVRLDLLANIPIPIPEDTAILTNVAALIRRSIAQRETYLSELQASRLLIESLPEMQDAQSMCAERRARTTLWSGRLPTLSARNYASTGAALSFLSRRWQARLGDLVPVEGLFRGGRYQRIPCERPFGIDFLSQRDVFSVRPNPRRIIQPHVPRDWVSVPEFSLLAGGQGTLGEGELFGRVALVTADMARAGVSEHLLRIQPRSRDAAAILYAFLSTLVGRRFLRSTGVGTKLLSMRHDLLRALPIPDVSQTTGGDILTHLETAAAARVASTEAEESAVRILEQQILPAWLA